MDEDGFEAWFQSAFQPHQHNAHDRIVARMAWLESARRADRKAREECARLCSELRRDNYAGETEDWIAGADDCAEEIRATIKEE